MVICFLLKSNQVAYPAVVVLLIGQVDPIEPCQDNQIEGLYDHEDR